MLTPNDIHYIVGILCKLTTPDNVSIVLGDMVYDQASEKDRDIDITISYKNDLNEEVSFIGLEVKDEKRPLGSPEVEQLCIKFKDMHSVIRGGIVSASGYSEPAIRKAKYHGIDLYEFKDWNFRGGELSHLKFSENFCLHETVIEWISPPNFKYIMNGLGDTDENVMLLSNQRIIFTCGDSTNSPKTVEKLTINLINKALKSQSLKETIDNADIGDEIPVNVSIEIQDPPFFVFNDKQIHLQRLYINGTLRKVVRQNKTVFKILVKYDDNDYQVGTAISEMSNGMLIGLTTSNEDKSVNLIWVPVPDRLKKKIYRNRIK